MANIHIPSPVLGIDISQSANLIDDRASADGTQNVDFDAGVIKPSCGFAKLSNQLESGEEVLGITSFAEVNGRVNIIAATQTKIHQHNITNDVWDELSGSTVAANIQYPVSFANVLHQDALSLKYQHLVICDGGRSNIIRWAGNGNNLVELAGGDGYNASSTAHRALQVCTYQNRMILVSPYEETGGIWIPNHSRVRWPVQAKLETWVGTGSGFVDLIDTGDLNVRAELLNNTLIIYQSHSIWQLRYIGGDVVFTPDILVPDLGLLAFNLCASIEGVHYFVGNDYNIYQYYGSASLTNIGKAISDDLKNSIDKTKLNTCRMAIDSGRRHLWIFVPSGNSRASKCYKYNLKTGSWTVREFGHKYATGGITAATLLAAGVYTVGDTYADAAAAAVTYAEAAAGTEITKSETPAVTTWNAAGKIMTGTGSTWDSTNKVTPGDIVQIISGTNATPGYYVVESVTSDTVMTLARSIGSSPVAVNYDIFNNDGASYASTLTEVRVEEKLTIGDSDGYVMQEDALLTADDGTEPEHYYITKEFDGSVPDISKRVDGIAVDCKGTSITLEYKLDDAAWVSMGTITLDSTYKSYRRFINRTGKKIQFRFSGIFTMRSYTIFNAQPEDMR